MSVTPRSLSADFWTQQPELQAFFGWPTGAIATHPEALRQQFGPVLAARGAYPVDRPRLVQALRRQLAGLPSRAAVQANVEALAQPDTWTVTTGQQPGLFGGPLYTLYKTLTVLHLAECLQQAFPDQRFVPVFWIASEDHDWAEVNHAYLHPTQLRQYAAEVHGPVGRHRLTDAIRPLVADLPELVRQAYTPGRSFSDAFRWLWHSLFADAGLVVLEPDDAELKAVLAPVIEREIREQPSRGAVEAASARLTALGYPAQIQARDINLFGLTDESRPRLLAEGPHARVEGTDQVLTPREAGEHAAAISPGVVLRPVYQERLLPNLAYVGGWAEVAYWAQLRGVFQAHETFFPVVLPRMQARLLSLDDQERWQAAGLTWGDLDRPLHELREHLVLQHWDPTPTLTHLATAEAALAALQVQAARVDAGQARNVAGQAQRLVRFGQRLRHRLIQAQALRHPEWVAALAVKQARQPDGVVQERVLNWLAFAGDNPDGWLAHLRQAAQPLAPGRQDLIVPGHAMQPV